ncbi:P-loop containing nucleoside triphosphate hydrolase protein, partial [Catenaria anguillulae PL171]
VFKSPPRGTRKIVLSTNIAETGVTIPDAVFVIDTGKAKITRYDEKKHMTRLRESFITQANCRQRQGRAGRVRPGFYFALYSQYRHDHLMADFEVPEVQRMALESTTLKIKVYHFDNIVDTFRKFLDPPPTSRVLAAIERLQATRALDEQLQLTPLGRFLGELPLDVELGKILAFGAFYGCIDAAVTIAAYLS